MKVIAIYTMFGIAMTGCGANSSNSQNEADDASVSNNETTKTDDDTTWHYFQEEDDLTHNVTAINAYVASTNRVEIDYNGHTARMLLSLRYSAGFSYATGGPSTSVTITFAEDNGMTRLSEINGSGILVVFDEGEIDDRWSLIDMGKKRNTLFMYQPRKVAPFVEELKSSKQVRIQVNLEHVGRKTFDFNIEGLEWDFEN
ncbi:MAG: hypothetical protein J1F25_02065 [Prevotellaceae bacterium]|nr:hypothetical protein [Prevotellaceae bacterium]